MAWKLETRFLLHLFVWAWVSSTTMSSCCESPVVDGIREEWPTGGGVRRTWWKKWKKWNTRVQKLLTVLQGTAFFQFGFKDFQKSSNTHKRFRDVGGVTLQQEKQLLDLFQALRWCFETMGISYTAVTTRNTNETQFENLSSSTIIECQCPLTAKVLLYLLWDSSITHNRTKR